MTTDVMAPARTIRAGFVGGGFMAGVHSRAAHAARAELAGGASSSATSARDAADRLGLDAAFDSVEALLADPDIDVVHVCTPNATHAAIARAAIEAGRHVICEKPLATSSADAAVLADLAAESGLVAAVPFVYRFHPMARGRVHGSRPATRGGCSPCTAPTSRTGWPTCTTTIGGSTPPSAARRAPSRTSDRTSSTSWSSLPATGSYGSTPRRAPCTSSAPPTSTSPPRISLRWSSSWPRVRSAPCRSPRWHPATRTP